MAFVRKARRKVRRILVVGAFGCFSLVVLVYVGFLIFMKVTEAAWLGATPFHASIDVRKVEDHRITLLDEGILSLAERLKIIEGAERTLDLEFVIYELDATSRMVSQALAAKAREGVKVRVLVDFSLAVFKLRPSYARLFESAGVEVKYYNTASVARFLSVQHRTHRKLLIADGRTAVLGGRNIADDYFDLSSHYNFLDSDVAVEGSVVSAIQESFDLYWASPWALDPHTVKDEESEGTVEDFLMTTDADVTLLETVRQAAAERQTPPRFVCPDVRFVTDYPGSGVNYRRVFPAIVETLAEARRDVTVESPYFVIRPDGAEVMKTLTRRGVRLKVLTNSLRSTDAYYTVAALLPSLGRFAMPNFELWAYGGSPLETYPNGGRSERWGVHAKRAVIDDGTVLIGTYNIDPRSANLNSELMLICRGSAPLATAMRESLERRFAQSKAVVLGEDKRDYGALVQEAGAESVLMMLLSMPVASVFNFLL